MARVQATVSGIILAGLEVSMARRCISYWNIAAQKIHSRPAQVLAMADI
jgi:hypothetical protein